MFVETSPSDRKSVSAWVWACRRPVMAPRWRDIRDHLTAAAVLVDELASRLTNPDELEQSHDISRHIAAARDTGMGTPKLLR